MQNIMFYVHIYTFVQSVLKNKKAPQKTEVLDSIVAIGIEPMTHGI